MGGESDIYLETEIAIEKAIDNGKDWNTDLYINSDNNKKKVRNWDRGTNK